MKSLRVVKAKPNPVGKDRRRGFTPAAQLAAEWVDYSNDGTENYTLDGVSLQHVAYQPGCRDPKWQWVMPFTGVLQPGRIVRVHSGQKISLSEMHPEDARGADFHLFTGRDYIWNNDCGDSVGLWNGTIWVDKAFYDPYPPDGAVLHRQGDKLVP